MPERLRKARGLSRCSKCSGGKACDRMKGRVMGGRTWPTCPIRIMRESAAWQVLAMLYNAAQVSPLANYPDGLCGWIVRGLITMQDVLVERDKAEANKGSEGDK